MSGSLPAPSRLGRFAGLGAAIVGVCVLLGWLLEVDLLRRLVPQGLPMNPTTALLLVLLGAALALVSNERRGPRGAVLAVAWGVLVVSTATFAARVLGQSGPIDHLFLADHMQAHPEPQLSHMRLNTALCLALLSGALILGRRRAPWRVILSQILSLTVAWIGLVAIVCYFYKIPSMSPFASFLPMALHTGISLVALAVGMLFLHPSMGLTGILFRRDLGGQLARRLIPPFILLPIGLGYLQLRGQQHGWFDSSVGGALLMTSLVVCSVGLIWWLAFSLSRSSRARAEAEEALRLSEALLSEAQTLAQMGSWEHDPATGAMAWSDELFRLLGWEPRAVAPERTALLQRVHPDDRERLRLPLEAGEPFAVIVRIVRPDESFRSLAMRGEVVTDAGDRTCRYIGVAQDVTEQQAVARMKDQFVSVVSHELRTPLTAIRGSLGLLASGRFGELAPKGLEMLEMAARNGERLMRVIDDLLDVRRMASGSLVLQRSCCTAEELLAQAADAMGVVAQRAGVTLVYEPSAVSVSADGERLVQVLTNLIDNAIKFSAAGSTVRFGAVPAAGEVRFYVADMGRGIPPEALERIFEHFGQLDASDSRQKGGTGLGLTICRSIVELHGGRIWATSKLREGSTFYFALPLAG